MIARVAAATPPFPSDIQVEIDRVMQGRPTLNLFATLARDPRLFFKFFRAGLLDKGHLTLREREIVIVRTTALCRSEYEWGVHIAVFAKRAGFSDGQVKSLTCGSSDDPCWSAPERHLIRMCDALHAECDVDDQIWEALKAHFESNGMIELLMLAGFYRTVSYLTNGLRLELEPDSARFADV